MSGPKYSEAELKRMEAERLEAERQKQLEQLRIVLEEAKGRLRKEYEGLFLVKDELLLLERCPMLCQWNVECMTSNRQIPLECLYLMIYRIKQYVQPWLVFLPVIVIGKRE